jgi:ribosomal protein S18 acetylase RimI-like enzyme
MSRAAAAPPRARIAPRALHRASRVLSASAASVVAPRVLLRASSSRGPAVVTAGPADELRARDSLLALQAAFERASRPLPDGGTVTIRPMRGEDVRAIAACMVEAFRGTPDERPRARVAAYLLDQLEPDPEKICLVAALDEDADAAPDASAAIGIASLTFSDAARGGADASARFEGHLACPPSAAYLCNMAVAGAHRGRGVAKALLSACDDLAGEMGFGEVYLHVREGDEVAYGLYEKRGYEAVARESAWKRALAGTGGGVALMKKKL